MGFGLAVGAAIVFTSLAVAGYQVTGTWFAVESSLRAASETATQLDRDTMHAGLAVTNLTWSAGVVTVKALNTGSVTLDASHADFLLDGVLSSPSAVLVDGHAGNVWPPGSTLVATLTGSQPTSAAVAADHGAIAFWRA